MFHLHNAITAFKQVLHRARDAEAESRSSGCDRTESRGETAAWEQQEAPISTTPTAVGAEEHKRSHTHTRIEPDRQKGETINTIYMWSILINSSECGKVVVNDCKYLLLFM